MDSSRKSRALRRLWIRYSAAAERLRRTFEKLGLMPIFKWFQRLLAIALLPILVPYFVAKLFSTARKVASDSRPVPAPGVIYGEGFFSKRLFYGDPLLGDVLLLKPWALESDDEEGILCAGSRGAVVVAHESQAVRRTLFPDAAEKVLVIRNDSEPTFLLLEQSGKAVTSCDAKGGSLWSYSLRTSINDIAVGDLNDDGSPVCLIATNGGGGLHAVDLKGRRLWRVRGANIWCVATFDDECEGNARIYHSHANGRLYIRDRHGTLLKDAKPRSYLGSFCLCNWPNRQGPVCMLGQTNDERLSILDADGECKTLLWAPEATGHSDVQATNVRFLPDQSDRFAVLLNYPSEERAMLFVCDEEGNPLYAEVLPHSAAGLMRREFRDTGQESLLIGGAGRIWEYRAAACNVTVSVQPSLRAIE